MRERGRCQRDQYVSPSLSLKMFVVFFCPLPAEIIFILKLFENNIMAVKLLFFCVVLMPVFALD